jgi:hypothetical protein
MNDVEEGDSICVYAANLGGTKLLRMVEQGDGYLWTVLRIIGDRLYAQPSLGHHRLARAFSITERMSDCGMLRYEVIGGGAE